ncbi:transposase [Neisseria iguanae]|uniref:transposase n=1 Tax=Neisseria iguanae TaxID=90242 RepID=UPI003CCB9C35
MNRHGCNHFEPRLSDIAQGTDVYADKGYDGQADRVPLQSKGLSDGMMRKAYSGRPSTEEDLGKNKPLSKTRYVVEQRFGTRRHIRYSRASYSDC